MTAAQHSDSPENLMYRQYSSKSDVWSFGSFFQLLDVYLLGVTIYEIVTNNEPYPDLAAHQAATLVVTKRVKLALPSYTTPAGIVPVFERCMAYKASDRPSFDKICKLLDDITLDN